jgi:hypothetical protein
MKHNLLSRNTKFTIFTIRRKNMNKTILRIVMTTLLLLALGTTSAVADSLPMPMCWPNPCSAQ